ncbi:MAG: GNAT family N-acetyltransferase, partial [Selenomonadaceae bacterium]|nr:GNAT family N-acetyltransferase [Selenomonadaceae bacterium]
MNYFSIGAYAFREIRESDLPLLLEWRNSPRVHSKMLTDHKITWEEHKNWFKRIQDEAREGYFIFTFNGEPVGYCCPGGTYLGAPDKCPRDAG